MNTLRYLIHFSCLTVISIWGGAVFADDAQPIRIGATVSKTGELAAFSQLVLNGLKLWQEDVNSRGALLGRAVEIVVYDDASNAKTAADRYRQLIDQDGIDLLLSPYSSTLTLAAQEVVRNRDAAMIAIASAPEIWRTSESNTYGIYTPANRNMDPVLQFAAKQGMTSVAMAHQTTEFPEAVARGVQTRITQFGLTLVANESYPAKGADFDTIASKLASANADVVIVGSYLDDAVAFTQAAKRTGLKTKLLAFSGGPALREFGDTVGHEVADGVLSTAQWMRSVRFPGSFDFGFRYRQDHNVYPGYDAAGGYAAMQVLEAAIRLAGSANPADVRRELGSMKFRSIIGHYRVNKLGMQTAKSTYLVQWQDSHISLVYPPELARWELRYPFRAW